VTEAARKKMFGGRGSLDASTSIASDSESYRTLGRSHSNDARRSRAVSRAMS
jgi:hypothetical protein